jgi:hypothetical protein
MNKTQVEEAEVHVIERTNVFVKPFFSIVRVCDVHNSALGTGKPYLGGSACSEIALKINIPHPVLCERYLPLFY